MTIYHNHHIVPKHAGGTDHPSNIIRITAEEHAQSHLELYQEFGRNEDLWAYSVLSGRNDIDTSGKNHPMFGKKHSDKTKRKMGEAKKGMKHFRWGKKLSEEHKKKISESLKGKINGWLGREHSEESKRKISESLKGENHPRWGIKGENNPLWGMKHSEETKTKMSKTHQGMKHSEETKTKMSESSKGKKHSAETKRKMSMARAKFK